MGAYTYLSDHEAEAGRATGDKELDDLLQQVNDLSDDGWRIRVRTYRQRKRWFRAPAPEAKHYTLYWYTGAGIEYQVINLVTPEGGSVFHDSRQSREDIANFLMGFINGHQDSARKGGTDHA